MKSRTELSNYYPMFWRDQNRTWDELLEAVEFHEGADWIDTGYTKPCCPSSGCEGCQCRNAVLVAEPGKTPRCAYVRCADLHRLVDGFVGREAEIYFLDDGVDVFFCRDGEMLGMELNRILKIRKEDSEVIRPMYGTVIVEISKFDVESVKSLVQKYIKLFC